MEKKASTYSRLLETTFNKDEISFLKKQPHFQTAVSVMRSFSDFDRVCAIGRRLLAKKPNREVSLSTDRMPSNFLPQKAIVRVDFKGDGLASRARPDQ